jgi:hypothetical protein
MSRLMSRTAVAAVAVGLALALPGCGSKITKENADKIKNGMAEQEVTDILGSPTESVETDLPDFGAMFGGMPVPGGGEAPPMPQLPKKMRTSTWKNGDKQIVVMFLDGKVVQKQATGF